MINFELNSIFFIEIGSHQLEIRIPCQKLCRMLFSMPNFIDFQWFSSDFIKILVQNSKAWPGHNLIHRIFVDVLSVSFESWIFFLCSWQLSSKSNGWIKRYAHFSEIFQQISYSSSERKFAPPGEVLLFETREHSVSTSHFEFLGCVRPSGR